MRIVDITFILIPILLIGSTADAGSSNAKLDTLYHYFMEDDEPNVTTVYLSNHEELGSFLQKTGFSSKKVMKEPAAKPDFSTKTVFAFAGWPCTIVNVLEDNTKITIHYRLEYHNTDPKKGIKYARPLNVAIIYSIPRTSKKIAFIDTTEKQ